MLVSLLRQAISDVQADWLAIGFFEDQAELPEADPGTSLARVAGRLMARKHVTGSLGELTPVHGVEDLDVDSILLFGLGSMANFDAAAAYTVGIAISKRLSAKPRGHVSVRLPRVLVEETSGHLPAFVEGLIAGTRGPGLHKTDPNRHPFERLSLLVDPQESDDRVETLSVAVKKAEIVGEAVNTSRDLVNTPPSEKPPMVLAERIAALARGAGLAVEVWDQGRIQNERFGGLLGVSTGSENPPAFVILRWLHGGQAPTVALVGKGVTFDSGGLSLKPSASMEDMKSDMTGASVVIAAMQAIARLNLPVNLVGYLALTENMTGGRAMKLGDVLRMRNGKTVEVLNTDAEGRLILADALSYAAESRPGMILDLATLTGACIVALGTRIAGLFSNNDRLARELHDAARTSGERVWRLPLDDDFLELLKSSVADLKNVGGKWAGAITAAKFLEQFVDSVPWAHLDIAGPSWNESENSTRDQGGTGCFVRTLVAWVESVGSGSEG